MTKSEKKSGGKAIVALLAERGTELVLTTAKKCGFLYSSCSCLLMLNRVVEILITVHWKEYVLCGTDSFTVCILFKEYYMPSKPLRTYLGTNFSFLIIVER